MNNRMNKKENYAEEEYAIDENRFKQLQIMIGDVTEVTKLLTNITIEENTYFVIKEQKKLEKKLNLYHIDDILMHILDNVIQSFIESNEEN